MMGHGGLIKLDKNYFKEHIDELIEEYLHSISNLTIDDSARKQLELDRVNKEKSELEKGKDAKNWKKMTEKITKRSDDQDKVIKMLVTKLQDLEDKYTENLIENFENKKDQ